MKRGFTLIEMLVVIVVIGILLAGLVWLVGGVLQQAKVTKTEEFIRGLKVACEHYRIDFDRYPPLTYTPSSQNLRHYLGGVWDVRRGVGGAGTPIEKKVGPYFDFKSDFLPPGGAAGLIDAWNQFINYENPCQGQYPNTCAIQNHGAQGGIRIWSLGPPVSGGGGGTGPGSSGSNPIISCKMVEK